MGPVSCPVYCCYSTPSEFRGFEGFRLGSAFPTPDDSIFRDARDWGVRPSPVVGWLRDVRFDSQPEWQGPGNASILGLIQSVARWAI